MLPEQLASEPANVEASVDCIASRNFFIQQVEFTKADPLRQTCDQPSRERRAPNAPSSARPWLNLPQVGSWAGMDPGCSRQPRGWHNKAAEKPGKETAALVQRGRNSN